jgi:DNA polymerase
VEGRIGVEGSRVESREVEQALSLQPDRDIHERHESTKNSISHENTKARNHWRSAACLFPDPTVLECHLKSSLYAELVRSRKACRLCADCGLTNASAVDEGRYDSAHIGSWTYWQGNLNAELMVVGQDWRDVRYFRENAGQDKAGNPTNLMLARLLRSICIEIGSPEQPTPAPVFLTNAVLCLKEGGLQGPVRREWFANCGRAFLRPQIELVNPAVVVGLGKLAFEAILSAFGLPIPRFKQAVESREGTWLPNGSRLFAVYHCGQRILNTHRPEVAQLQDWQRIGAALASVR